MVQKIKGIERNLYAFFHARMWRNVGKVLCSNGFNKPLSDIDKNLNRCYTLTLVLKLAFLCQLGQGTLKNE
jgi:hypothetical protein